MSDNVNSPPKTKKGDPDRALELAIRSYTDATPKTAEIVERAKAFNDFMVSALHE